MTGEERRGALRYQVKGESGVNEVSTYRRVLGISAIVAVLILGGAARTAFAQQNRAGDVETIEVVPNFYMIVGAGGNIAVQTGPDGVVLVNAGSADMSDKVIAAIKKLTPEPIRYIIDTNADPDNVGGNASVSKAGQSFTQATNTGPGGLAVVGPATILATESVLKRMSAPTGKQGAYPTDAWPTETFFQDDKAMYANGEGIEVMTQPAAHSENDVMVFFRRSDVLVVGDLLDTTRFPVIDIAKGGSIQGEIQALNRIVHKAIPSIPLVWQDRGTQIIPAHGRICDQADVVEYRDMVTVIRDVVEDMIHRGMTLEQVKAANPTFGYRKRYGADSGPWTTDMFVEAVYKGLKAKK
jgi:glyoxylase-like metal-dependent hydrolase (beta-lactamase superfamily II)